jgi:hypothetical protein
MIALQPGPLRLVAATDAIAPDVGEVVAGMLMLGWLIVAVRATASVMRRRSATRTAPGEPAPHRRGRLSPLLVGLGGASAAFGVSMLVGAGVLDEPWRLQWLLLAGAGVAVLVIDGGRLHPPLGHVMNRPQVPPSEHRVSFRDVWRIRMVGALGVGLALYGWAMASPAIVRDERIEPVWVMFIVVGLPMSVWTMWREWRVRRDGRRGRRSPR